MLWPPDSLHFCCIICSQVLSICLRFTIFLGLNLPAQEGNFMVFRYANDILHYLLANLSGGNLDSLSRHK